MTTPPRDENPSASRTARYRVLDAKILHGLHDAGRDFAIDVLVGLSEDPKQLPSKYFYDDLGSKLYSEIMDLEEYYQTGCEREILETHRRTISEPLVAAPFNVIDLGAGDGRKTMLLLDHLCRTEADFRYVPIDISEAAMRHLVMSIERQCPSVEVDGLVSSYVDGLRWLSVEPANRRNLVLFLGSNIGNFDRVQSRAFLRRLWNALRQDDYLLIGFDLKKDIDLLLRAYNDSKGVTAAFNLNLLQRINSELGGTFDLSAFRHHGTYDVFTGAMESYLVSLQRQSVHVEALQRAFEFEAWEPIHVEYSYKYLDSDIDSLATDTGFSIAGRFFDSRRWFVDSLWRVDKAHDGT